MTKEEIRELVFNFRPGDKYNFFPEEFKDARSVIAAARKSRNIKIISTLIGNSKSFQQHLSVYCPKNDGDRIVSADINCSLIIGNIPVVAMKKTGDTTWLIMFDSGSEITIFDRRWLMECKGLTEEDMAGGGDVKLSGIGGEQANVGKPMATSIHLETADGRSVILCANGISSDLSMVNDRFGFTGTDEKVMMGALIGADALMDHHAIINFSQMRISLQDLIFAA